MIAIPKSIMVGAGVIVLIGMAVFMADKNGYNRAIKAVNAEAAVAAKDAKDKQAADQKAINDLAGQFYESTEQLHKKTTELNSLKNRLRRSYAEPKPDCFCRPGDVMPAVYRMFNEAADNPDLPQLVGTVKPDDAGDGLEAIQRAVTEYNKVAIQLNTLQDVVKSSECFER